MKLERTIRRCGAFVLMVMLLLSLTVPCYAAKGNAVSDARSGVVRVFAWNEETGSGGSGSGFAIGVTGEETQYFITNWHVVADSDGVVGTQDVYILLDDRAVEMGTFAKRHPGADGKKGTGDDYLYAADYVTNIDTSMMIKCEVIYAANQYPDVAILKAERKVPDRKALKLRSSRDVPEAADIYAMGYPAVADGASTTQYDMTNVKENDQIADYYYYASVDSVHITGGVVSKMGAFEIFGNTYCIEHDANINHGNSGGPLVDEDGNVVGINTYGLNAEGSEGFLNYSVYIDYAMDYLNQLGIAYDYVGMEEPFPVGTVAAGGVVVLILIVVLIVVLSKKAKKKPAVDTGLRVQYDADAMMSNKRYVINGTLRFGRAPDCNIQYRDDAPGVSSHHCEIIVDMGRVYIRDLNSSHGTYINGSRIPSNQQIELSVGNEVALGSAREKFQIVRSSKR